MHGDINPQIREVMEVKLAGKRKKVGPRNSWKEYVKKDLEHHGLRREDVYHRKKWQEQIKGKIANPG